MFVGINLYENLPRATVLKHNVSDNMKAETGLLWATKHFVTNPRSPGLINKQEKVPRFSIC